jgi:glycosyltransferase A (GT-A) superfamily protein (DUF2064 family)
LCARADRRRRLCLIGFRREALAAIDEVFGAIAWGSPTVMSSTRDQLQRAGLRWTELATLVDTTSRPT